MGERPSTGGNVPPSDAVRFYAANRADLFPTRSNVQAAAEFSVSLKRKGMSAIYVRNATSSLKRFTNAVSGNIADVTVADINRFLDGLKKLGPVSKNRIHRKSVNFGPFRVNLSKSGLGYSVGGRGFLGDVNDRKAISVVRIFLRIHVMPSKEDPFHEFEDRWGIRFTVNDQIGRCQVKTIEENEIADNFDENSPFTYQDDIDPIEMAGFSVWRT